MGNLCNDTCTKNELIRIALVDMKEMKNKVDIIACFGYPYVFFNLPHYLLFWLFTEYSNSELTFDILLYHYNNVWLLLIYFFSITPFIFCKKLRINETLKISLYSKGSWIWNDFRIGKILTLLGGNKGY